MRDMRDGDSCLMPAAREARTQQWGEVGDMRGETRRLATAAREPRAQQWGELRDGPGENSHRVVDAEQLPRHRSEGPTRPGSTPANRAKTAILARNYRGRNVLLISDDPINHRIAAALRSEIRLVIDVADNGIEAVEMTHHVAYDLILMDMQMAKIDALEATREIRKIPCREAVPILAMTDDSAKHRQRCFDAGMNDLLAKPLKLDQICDIMLTWLARARIRGSFVSKSTAKRGGAEAARPDVHVALRHYGCET
jgi:CheY-like chemotaxis protein